MHSVTHKLFNSKWLQVPLCLGLQWTMSLLADQIRQAPQLALPLTAAFLPGIFWAFVLVALTAAMRLAHVRLKHALGYLMVITGVLLFISGTLRTVNVLHPVPALSIHFGSDNIRPDTGMSKDDIAQYEEMWAPRHPSGKAHETPSSYAWDHLWRQIDVGLNAIGLKDAFDAVASQVARIHVPMPTLSPPAMIFLTIVSSAIWAVLGAALLEGHVFPGATHSFQDLERRHPFLRGVEAAFQTDFVPWLATRETQRISAVRMRLIAYALGVPATIYCSLEADLASTVILLVVTVLWAELQAFMLRRTLRAELPTRLCSFFGLTYNEAAVHARPMLLDGTGIVPMFNSARTRDEIAGRYHGASFCLYRAHLFHVSHGYRSGNASTVFRGVVLQFTLPRTFAGRTRILKDRGRVGNAVRAAFDSTLERIGLGRPDLDRNFEAYSDDERMTRALSSPDLADGLAELSRIFSGDVSLQAQFSGNTALIAIDGVDDLFDFDLGTPLTDLNRYSHFAEGLAAAFGIVDILQASRPDTDDRGERPALPPVVRQ